MLKSLKLFWNEDRIIIPKNQQVTAVIENWNWYSELMQKRSENQGLLNIELEENSKLHICNLHIFKQENLKINLLQKSNTELFWFNLIKDNVEDDFTINIKGNDTTTKLYNLAIPEENKTININQKILTNFNKNTVNHLTKAVQKYHSYVNITHTAKAQISVCDLILEQRLQVLSMSSEATQIMKPILEIQSPMVNCVHSASVSSVDQMSLEYLQSRGLNFETSQNLLVEGFIKDLINKIPILCLQEEIIKYTF
jgi:Fe-S cluster assembly scaffold protein SufB